MSPRRRVRVDERDDVGRWRHAYDRDVPLRDEAPEGPFALYLADGRRRFRLLLFDLDAKHGPVAEDVRTLTGWCEDAGLRPIVARSGPGGGAHVWVVLAQPVAADVVAGLARAAARRLPTLDVAPLLNAATGCGRPPGAPHRAGGRSEPVTDLSEALAVARDGGDSPAAVARLLDLLQVSAPTAPAPPARASRPAPLDEDGHPHLVGPRRSLSSAGQTALATQPRPREDASAVLARVLVHAALARWRYGDVEALLESAPGLEHARTRRAHRGAALRLPRSPAEARKVLAEQWRRAVAHAAAAPAADVDDDAGADAEFARRAASVTAAVAAVQQRADASPGRWTRPGGTSARRVLDAVCQLCLWAVRDDVEADERRLALMTGLGRSTVNRALRRLAGENWLRAVAPGAGVRGARWGLPAADPAPPAAGAPPLASSPAAVVETTDSHPCSQGVGKDGSQATLRPGAPPAPSDSAAPARRAAWLSRLSARGARQAVDVFCHQGLGHHRGKVYDVLTVTRSVSELELATSTGYPLPVLRAHLDALAVQRLARRTPTGWRRGRGSTTTAAKSVGVHGLLADRQRRYVDERLVWAWWREELEWMRRPRSSGAAARRLPGVGQPTLPVGTTVSVRDRLGRMPRRAGRVDFAAAAAMLRRRRTGADQLGLSTAA